MNKIEIYDIDMYFEGLHERLESYGTLYFSTNRVNASKSKAAKKCCYSCLVTILIQC